MSLLLAAALLASPVGATIERVSYRGAGCAPGSVNATLSGDGASLTLAFAQLWASASGDVTGPQFDRRGCDVLLDLYVPPGWQLDVATIDARGYASVEGAARAVQTSHVYFPPAPPPPEPASLVFDRPFDGSYQRHFELPTGAFASPCGGWRQLRVEAVVTAQARRGTRALLAVDSADGNLEQRYGLSWRRCE